MSSIAISSTLVALSIVAIVYLTAKVKFSVFGSLFAVSIVLALSTNVPLEKVVDLLKSSFGNTLGSISFIIIFGAAIAVCMERSGGALSIATHILQKAGKNNAKPAMAWTGFIPGLTIFCDTGYIILSGIARSISAKSQTPMPLMAAILGSSLFAVHCLVPTHPGALAAATTLNANLGLFILAGVVFAIPGLLAAYYWAGFMCKGQNYAPAAAEENEQQGDDRALPAFTHALLPVVLPLVLISISTLLTTLGHKTGVANFFHFLGNPVIALLVGMLCGLWLLSKHGGQKGDFTRVLEEAIVKAGPILIITAAGGMFGAVIKESGVGAALGQALGNASIGLLVPFIIAALLKTAQGSSTVAALTTAAIISPSLASFGLDSEMGRLFAVLAIGAGSIVVSHANDSYFWVVTKFSNIEMQQSLRVFSTSTLVMGLVSFAFIWLASAFML